MPTNISIGRNSEQRPPSAAEGSWMGPALALPLLVAGLYQVMPGPLVLPALSLVLLLAGFSLAVVNRLSPATARGRGARRRDMAALLVLVGFAAAILTDGAEALRLLGEVETALASRPAVGR